jgi:predicted nucleotide-binding protein (sugar kinase/HSP70/actin superfamily)
MAEKTQTFPLEINELNRRIRMVEIKTNMLEERISSIEKLIQQLRDDIKIIKDVEEKKISNLKNEISSITENIKAIDKKTDQFATKVELQKIKILLEVFNPLTSNFVLKEELESKLEELKKSILKQENKI